MLAKLLCKLGLHQPVVTLPAETVTGRYSEGRGFALGFCARCNKPYQWDH